MASNALVHDEWHDARQLAQRLAEGVTLAHPVLLQQFRQALQCPEQCEAMRAVVAKDVISIVCIDGRCAPLLHHAASQGEVGWLQVLLALGAPWDAVDLQGQSAAHWALEAQATPAFLALMALGMPPAPPMEGRVSTLVHAIAQKGDARCLDGFMQQAHAHWPRATWDRPDAQGLHPLHHAIDRDDTALMSGLLRWGADWRERDADGNTAAERYALKHPADPAAFLRDLVRDPVYAAWMEARLRPNASTVAVAPTLRVRSRVAAV